MRHTRCTDISINTVDVDSLSDGGGGAKWIEQSSGVRHIDDISLRYGTSTDIQFIYVIWGGRRAVDMNRGGGVGGQGETTFICGRVIGGNALETAFRLGGAVQLAATATGDGT